MTVQANVSVHTDSTPVPFSATNGLAMSTRTEVTEVDSEQVIAVDQTVGKPRDRVKLPWGYWLLIRNSLKLQVAPETVEVIDGQPMATLNVEHWRAIRTVMGLQINPGTAVVIRRYAQVLDPYGVDPELPAESDCGGNTCFARNPESDLWVHQWDIPAATWEAIVDRGAAKPEKRWMSSLPQCRAATSCAERKA